MVRAWSASARDRLPDPQCRVRREFISFPVIEFLCRFKQAHVPFLNKIKEREGAGFSPRYFLAILRQAAEFASVSLRFASSFLVRSFWRVLFFIARNERYLADLAQIHLHGILRGIVRFIRFFSFVFLFLFLSFPSFFSPSSSGISRRARASMSLMFASLGTLVQRFQASKRPVRCAASYVRISV